MDIIWVREIEKMKRFNLVIPDEIYDRVGDVAEKYDTSRTEIMKRYIRLGLKIEKEESLHVFRDENGQLKEVQYI